MNCFEKLYTPAGLLSLLEVISGRQAFIVLGEDGVSSPREPGKCLPKGEQKGAACSRGERPPFNTAENLRSPETFSFGPAAEYTWAGKRGHHGNQSTLLSCLIEKEGSSWKIKVEKWACSCVQKCMMLRHGREERSRVETPSVLELEPGLGTWLNRLRHL